MDSSPVEKHEKDDANGVSDTDNRPGPSRSMRSTRSNFTDNSDDFSCPVCGFMGDSRATKSYHMRQEHPGYDPSIKYANNIDSTPKKGKRGRPKRENNGNNSAILINLEEEKDGEEVEERLNKEAKLEDTPRCLTTKELIGGGSRKRKEKPIQTLQTILHSNLEQAAPSTSDQTVADFLRSQNLDALLGLKNNQEENHKIYHTSQEDQMLDVGQEVEIFDENVEESIEERRRKVVEHVNSYRVNIHNIGENAKKNTGKMGAPRKKPATRPKVYDPENIPFRLRQGDVNGKYECYIRDCEWKGAYRSLRMEHMRAVHPEWKMPSRFLLQRISRDGVYIDPEKYIPPFGCTVPDCDWRGNYRASRSAHMRQCHTDIYLENKKKLAMGSYHSDGNYLCHLAECDWRGASRSTRAAHMKKEHPGWKTESLRKATLLECFHCAGNFPSHPALIAHIDEYHQLGLHVDLTFETRTEYLIWLATVERFYQIEFLRRMCHRHPLNMVKYSLVCACGAQNNEIVENARSAIYLSSFLKKRNERIMARRKINCCLYLEVKEEINPEGRITVTGCLEHTGHRFGTMQLRFNLTERQAFHDFMNYRNENRRQMAMTKVLDMCSEIDGDGFANLAPTSQPEEVPTLDKDSIISLYKMIEQDENLKESIFENNLVTIDDDGEIKTNTKFSFGYMSEEMKRIWTEFGVDRIAIIEQVSVELAKYALTIFSVLVMDATMLPKCCCVYLTTEHERGFEAVIRQLVSVNERPPRTFLVDPSQTWIDQVNKYWPEEEVDVQISEWTLLDHWGTVIERLIRNDLDQFCLMVSLRRLLKQTNTQQFVFFVIELFEAIFEIGQEDFFKFLDYQLSDVEYMKRWSPLHRSPFIADNNQTFTLFARCFRERFLSPVGMGRVDVYVMHLQKMIDEFNTFDAPLIYVARGYDGPREIDYRTIMTERHHQTQVFETEEEEEGEIAVYVDGEEVEVQMEEIYEESQEDIDDQIHEEPDMDHIEIVHEEEIGEVQEMEEEEEEEIEEEYVEEEIVEEMIDVGSNEEVILDQSEQPKRLEHHDEKEEEEEEREKVQTVVVTTKKKHETTKDVIGSRRTKSRFRLPPGMDLQNLDRVTIREIASQVIDSDGRKGSRLPQAFISPQYHLGYGGRVARIETTTAPDPNQPSTSRQQPSTSSSERPTWRNF